LQDVASASELADCDVHGREAEAERVVQRLVEKGEGGAVELLHDGAHPLLGFSAGRDRKSTRLNSSHDQISYAVFCLKKKIARAAVIWALRMRMNTDVPSGRVGPRTLLHRTAERSATKARSAAWVLGANTVAFPSEYS